MRRSRLIALVALTWLCLLLCAASCVMGVRSFFVRDIITWARVGGNSHLAQSILGRLHVMSRLDGGSEGGFSHASDRLSPAAVWHGGMSSYPVRPEWHGPFLWQTYTRSPQMSFAYPGMAWTPTHHRLIVIPYWALAIASGLFPAARGLRWWLRRRKPRAGFCAACAYDLTGNVSGVCPECGKERPGINAGLCP